MFVDEFVHNYVFLVPEGDFDLKETMKRTCIFLIGILSYHTTNGSHL